MSTRSQAGLKYLTNYNGYYWLNLTQGNDGIPVLTLHAGDKEICTLNLSKVFEQVFLQIMNRGL